MWKYVPLFLPLDVRATVRPAGAPATAAARGGEGLCSGRGAAHFLITHTRPNGAPDPVYLLARWWVAVSGVVRRGGGDVVKMDSF